MHARHFAKVGQSDEKRSEARSPSAWIGRVVGESIAKIQVAPRCDGLQNRKLFSANFRSDLERVFSARYGQVVGKAVSVLHLDRG